MTPHAVKLGDLTAAHVGWAAYVHRMIRDLPDAQSCHTVCEKVAAELPTVFIHYRGHFHGTWDHSWLVFRDNPDALLDPYPWASGGGPLLVTLAGVSPWRGLYRGQPVTPAVTA
jgi:hypothetical protein